MGRYLTFTLTLAFISAFANIGGSAQLPTDAPTDFPTSTPTTSTTEEPTSSTTGFPTFAPTEGDAEPTDAPVAPTDAPTDFPTSTPTTSTTGEPTSGTTFDCDTDQVLTVAVETDDYVEETSWVVEKYEKYEGDVWTEVASTTLFPSPNLLFTSNICLDEAGVYRFSIFDSYGDGLCFGNNCGFFEVTLNGNVIAKGVSFGDEDVTVFNTCVDELGTFTVEQGGTQTGTCDDLVDFVAGQNRIGGIACRKNNLVGYGRVRDFCPNTCGLFGEGECASP